MDKTLKLHAYTDTAKSDVAPGNHAQEKNSSLELAHKHAQLEEEKGRSLELLKTIMQLRESLKQEQAKAAGMEIKLNKLVELEENQLARKNAQLEEEKNKSLELMKTIEQLREIIKHDQAKNAGAGKHAAELEAKTKELAALETRVKDMSAALDKIAGIAAAGKLA